MTAARAIGAALLALLAAASDLRAQDTHLLVVAGVGGDADHVKKFHAWSVGVLDAAKKLGVADANVTYLGENTEQGGGRMNARATKDIVTKTFGELAGRLKPNDDLFVVLIGHGSFDGRVGAFNLPGPDLSAADYATLLGRFPTQRIVFVNTSSSSGAFLEPLAGPARTIVTATKTGGERNETRFPEYFVEALAAEAADRDRNGRVSVQEAFDYAAGRVKAVYEQSGNIITEHATIDDSSQGKLASAVFLAPERSRTVAAQSADPALRALLEQRDAVERQVTALRIRKDSMPPAQYEQDLETLLTDLARKTRAIRDFEATHKP